MADAICKLFPHHAETIEELLKKGATFREICTDYDEASGWPADYCHSEGLPSERCDHARELIRNLEGEIKKVLMERGF
jgi:hypothetical protein